MTRHASCTESPHGGQRDEAMADLWSRRLLRRVPPAGERDECPGANELLSRLRGIPKCAQFCGGDDRGERDGKFGHGSQLPEGRRLSATSPKPVDAAPASPKPVDSERAWLAYPERGLPAVSVPCLPSAVLVSPEHGLSRHTGPVKRRRARSSGGGPGQAARSGAAAASTRRAQRSVAIWTAANGTQIARSMPDGEARFITPDSVANPRSDEEAPPRPRSRHASRECDAQAGQDLSLIHISEPTRPY